MHSLFAGTFGNKESQPGKDIYKIKFTEDLPSDLPCILFDIASNLRAALDQAGYATAVAAGKPNPKGTNFPFGDDAAEVKGNIERRRRRDWPPEIEALFIGFKPYKAGNYTLWALNKICNAKKHCGLVPLGIRNAVANFRAEVPIEWVGNSINPITGQVNGWNAEKREMTLVTVPSGTNPHITGHFTFAVAIEATEAAQSVPGIEIINDMASTVRIILMGAEEECCRIGLRI
jgi:hypothetical protein